MARLYVCVVHTCFTIYDMFIISKSYRVAQVANFDSGSYEKLFATLKDNYKDQAEKGLTHSEVLWAVFHGNQQSLDAAIAAGDCAQDHDAKYLH